VIACEPKALILDEPTAGLDEEAAARVHGLIHELKSRGVTILLISHSQDEVDELADRTIMLGKPAKRADSKESTESTVKATCEEEPDAEPSVDAAGSDTATVGERRTLLERLDPRVGMLSALALMFSAFAIGSFWQLLLAVVFAGVIAAAGRINVGRLAASVRVFLALFVFCGLLNIFFVRTGTTVASLGPIPITDDGIRIAILYACRFAVVIVIGAMFLASTTPTAMTDAFESLLSPFARFGLHTQETALVMSLALRFLPTLGVETKAIIDAQSARGGSVETGSFVVRIKAMVAVVVPVFAAAIRHADNLSLALDARCYEEGATRTHWRVMRVTGMDVAVAIVMLVYLVALVVLGVLL
jgi:energy-coupling factor transport system ATP-binding protein